MKRPEEIKKGLERCADGDCHKCPYSGFDCAQEVNADALTYIQQLEAELEAVKRERDAAVRGLHGDCETCKHYETENCAYCVHDPDAWCAHEENWEWEGVCPENAEVQDDE